MKIRGYFLAALAAAAYGTNPAFAVPLYEQGVNPVCVLLFRYLMSLPILLTMMAWRGQNLRISRKQLWPVAGLGLLMGISSLGLFESYRYMNAGVASTLLFMYPVMVAVLMTMFFHERFRITTGICLLVMGAGLWKLMQGGDGGDFSLTGFGLVSVSSLTYALYLVVTNVASGIREIPTLKLLFYQLLFGSVVFVVMFAFGVPLTVPQGWTAWGEVVALSVLPTAVSLGCTTMAIHLIGSTPTAIFGALEPVTAVALSVIFLGQPLTGDELAGGLLILVATTMVIAADPIDKALLRMRKMFPSRRHP